MHYRKAVIIVLGTALLGGCGKQEKVNTITVGGKTYAERDMQGNGGKEYVSRSGGVYKWAGCLCAP